MLSSTSSAPGVSPGKALNWQTVSARAEDAAPLVSAQNAFGARLIARLEGSNTAHANLLVSPTSLWQALAMTSLGARGQTKTQLDALLSLGSLSGPALSSSNRAFNTLLQEQ